MFLLQLVSNLKPEKIFLICIHWVPIYWRTRVVLPLFSMSTIFDFYLFGQSGFLWYEGPFFKISRTEILAVKNVQCNIMYRYNFYVAILSSLKNSFVLYLRKYFNLIVLFPGIPTVKREFQSYLVPTLQSVFDNMSQVIFSRSDHNFSVVPGSSVGDPFLMVLSFRIIWWNFVWKLFRT